MFTTLVHHCHSQFFIKSSVQNLCKLLKFWYFSELLFTSFFPMFVNNFCWTLLLTTFDHNFYTTYVKNICSQLLCSKLFFTTFIITFLYNLFSLLFPENYVHNSCSQLMFVTLIHTFCAQVKTILFIPNFVCIFFINFS